ncbi:MAG TPA: glycosyltransferase family 2 protein, partial [Gemmatimonadota bacterium]|nr:glycosyltransferase family 2 protein [Gemmatimonadota bacterium]
MNGEIPNEQDGRSSPKISVVTPSLNQARFIEQTLRSVLDQKYPNLEYIVIDGGSTDGTVDILRRYESRLEHWISEPDLGQADAINKGFVMATGEICSFLNSDDLYVPGALTRVAADFAEGNGREWHAYPVQDFTADRLLNVHEVPGLSRKLGDVPLEHRNDIANELLLWVVGRVQLHQPGVFWRRKHWLEVGGLEIRYHYAFDRQFFMKL